MLILRLVGALLIIGVGMSALLYLVTGSRKWLHTGWKILALGLIILLIILAFYVFERVVVAL